MDFKDMGKARGMWYDYVIMAVVNLKKGKEKSVLLHHPWIFSGALKGVTGHAKAGDIVRVADFTGHIIATGFYNPASPIPVRLFLWGNQPVESSFWEAALEKAISGRNLLYRDPLTNSYRLIFSESDMLPGLIVDRYRDYLIMQTLNPGMDRMKMTLAQHLMEMVKPMGIYEKNDSDIRKLEGLTFRSGLLLGEPIPETIEITEHGYQFLIDPIKGQKTGFYLDQRENRAIVARYAGDKTVLDAFSYTGGFSVYAAGGGARSLTRVDTSQEALGLGSRNLSLNLDTSIPNEAMKGNVFQVLRKFRDAGRQFDMIILDPPKLAPTRAHRGRATRGYKDINVLALKLLQPGGILATFSCSGGINAETFERILSWAAKDTRREVQILKRLFQGPDHPVRLSFPEGAYLKGFLCRVL